MNFSVNPSESFAREFIAIVLAGFGNELLPLTSDHGDEPCPKALLPVFNRPMLDYPLSWLEQSRIKDVLLICPSSHRPAISHYIHSDSSSTSFSSLHIDIQTYDESQDFSAGTCYLLKHFSNRIKEDFVLLPCDFIPPPSLPLSALLNKFRTDVMSDGSVATACWFENRPQDKGSIVEEWGPSPVSVPIVWDETSGTLLYIDTPDDLDRNAEEVELRMGLLSRYPRAKLSVKFHDSHVYVCKRAVLDVLHQKPHLDSFREDFFPWLCKLQYQKAKRGKYGQVINPISSLPSYSMSLKHSTVYTDIFLKTKPPMLDHSASDSSSLQNSRDTGFSIPPSPAESDEDPPIVASLKIGVIIHRAREGFATRSNNLSSYLEANRHFLVETYYVLPSDPTNRALIDQKAAISSDSLIGDFTKVEEKTNIKRSVIGKHCVIGKLVKIVGCVLLDHCVVADGAKLESCILGKNTKVGAKAELTRCVTQAGYEVRDNESFRNEKLDVSDWTAGAENGYHDEHEGSDESEDSE